MSVADDTSDTPLLKNPRPDTTTHSCLLFLLNESDYHWVLCAWKWMKWLSLHEIGNLSSGMCVWNQNNPPPHTHTFLVGHLRQRWTALHLVPLERTFGGHPDRWRVRAHSSRRSFENRDSWQTAKTLTFNVISHHIGPRDKRLSIQRGAAVGLLFVCVCVCVSTCRLAIYSQLSLQNVWRHEACGEYWSRKGFRAERSATTTLSCFDQHSYRRSSCTQTFQSTFGTASSCSFVVRSVFHELVGRWNVLLWAPLFFRNQITH